ncbi:MAG: ABC transporter substrate-binding protein [bacterium]
MKTVLAVIISTALLAGLGVAAQSAPAPRGGTLIIADGSDAATLDGHLFTTALEAERIDHMCETLFDLTPDGRIVPRLATGFTTSPNGLRVSITIRQGVRFHDGTPLTAQAVRFNLERVLDPASRASFRSLINLVTQVVVTNPTTVVLVTSVPFAPLLGGLTHQGTCIQSPTAIEARGADFARNPVATGQFRFKEWVRGDRLSVSRFDDYWGEKANLDEIQWRVIPDDGARVAAVESGAVHVAKRVPPREVSRLQGRGLRVEIIPSLRTIFIAFNVTKAPFNNKRVRQALNYAVNKELIVRTIMNGTARVSDAPIGPGIQGYTRIMSYEYDVDRARQLLREAGFPSGFRAQFHHPVARYIEDAQIAVAVQAMLRRVGVELELVPMDIGTLVTFVNKPPAEATHQMYMLGWGTATGDADYGLINLFHRSTWAPNGFNRGYYQNPQVDSLIDRARATFEQEDRNRFYRQAMEIIMDDAPWIFLHVESQTTAYRAEVQNMFMHPAERLKAQYAFLRR